MLRLLDKIVKIARYVDEVADALNEVVKKEQLNYLINLPSDKKLIVNFIKMR